MANVKDPVQLCTATVVASTLKISIRQFYRLQKYWQEKRLLKPGKHFIRVGKRAKRYDIDAILQLAQRHGY